MNLQKSLALREGSSSGYPGYVNKIGDADDQRVRASWVVLLYPYLEQPELWNASNAGKYAFAEVELLICPSDPPIELGHPSLSYVANAGYVANVDGVERLANGVLRSHADQRRSAGARGWARSRRRADALDTSNYLQQHDGVNHTLLLTESIRAPYWGYATLGEQQTLPGRKYHFGFCWEQPGKVAAAEQGSDMALRRINGNPHEPEYTSFAGMTASDGFPANNHPGGVNVAFAGGSVRFVRDQIDPLVYAQLMTSKSAESELVAADDRPDAELELDDGDY